MPDQTSDCDRIYEDWHRFAKERDVERLLAFYAEDAVFESPLVPAILDDMSTGVLRGRAQIRRFPRACSKAMASACGT